MEGYQFCLELCTVTAPSIKRTEQHNPAIKFPLLYVHIKVHVSFHKRFWTTYRVIHTWSSVFGWCAALISFPVECAFTGVIPATLS